MLRIARATRTFAQVRRLATRANGLLSELEARGLVQETTSSALRTHIDTRADDKLVQRTIYSGVDPSAQSLHVGNLLPLLGLLHFARHGHRALVLVGGATGAIGDPSGRSSERSALDAECLDANMRAIRKQVREFFVNANAYLARRGRSSAKPLEVTQDAIASARLFDGLDIWLLNNLEWTQDVSVLDFLGRVGRYARVTDMLARDSVKSRLTSTDSSGPVGLSFTELSYQLLQAFDFDVLHTKWNCSIQLGGSDQLGNISAGIDLIRRRLAAAGTDMKAEPAYGLTLPLLTTASGAKFGKSAGNAVWISSELLSDFDFYQYFMRSSDADVGRYMRTLTLMNHEEIEAVLAEHATEPSRRIAQTRLADEMTELVRGVDAVRRARTATGVLFGRNVSELSVDDVLSTFDGDSRLVRISRDEWVNSELLSLLVHVRLVKSKGEGRRLIQNGGVYANGTPVQDVGATFGQDALLHNTFAVLRVGKANHRIVVVE
ncbi:tyrosine--tRNA ligase [Malassezia cuniculi]|uniref:Tyrosine--tRNA ligase n=1 Tax=Malassezia cuniculi TaxID=948313 RepID=A0AAF0ETE6_9BASI|nr:tyrosine--tRNA ligase [Malassezia cuniculi]